MRTKTATRQKDYMEMKQIPYIIMNIIMNIILITSLFAFMCFPQTSHAFEKKPATGLSLEKLNHNGQKRTYYLHLPYYKPATNLPIVLVLHGGGKADGDETAKHTGYNQLADQHGFIVAYPNGLDSQWNDGRGRTYRNANNRAADDVGFISALIDTIIRDYKADASRVYVTGISNGGMMTLRLGCELSSKLAAIAPVIANIPQNIIKTCRPDSHLSLLLMNGTHDPLVPWNGGEVKFFRKKMGKVVSTQETIQFWVKQNQCRLIPSKKAIANTDKRDGSRVTATTYSCPKYADEVILYAVHGGGHTFPGSNARHLPLILGRKNNDINGAEIIWQFFSRHSN